jgi:enoyl-CoA hydratase/carnithine racemase
MSEDALLRLDHTAHVLTITLDQPQNRNALSMRMIDALTQALNDAERDPAVKVVVLAAHGPAFCAGHDLKEITANRKNADKGTQFFETLMHACSRLMLQIITLPKPVIAAVEGIATAAGCQLVATCDLAVAGAKATFQTPGVHIGLFCSTPMVALSRKASRKAIMEMLLLGEPVSAEKAEREGLLNRVVPEGSALVEAQRMAGMIAAKSGNTLAIGKEAFYRQAEMPLADAYAYASAVMTQNMLDESAREGIGAFLEKRVPNW